MKKKVFCILMIAIILLLFGAKNVYGEKKNTEVSEEKKTNIENNNNSNTNKKSKIETIVTNIGSLVISVASNGRVQPKVAKDKLEGGVETVKEAAKKGVDAAKAGVTLGYNASVAGMVTALVKNDGDINKAKEELQNENSEALSDLVSNGADLFEMSPVGQALNIASKILNAFGEWIIDFFLVGLGDVIQSIINGLQTYALNGTKDFPEVMYSESELSSRNDINQYININSSYSNNTPKYKCTVNDKNFDSDLEYPFIPVEFYSLSTGKVAATDINFLSIDESIHNNKKKGIWDIVRNIAVALMRGAIYLSAAALITSLIYHGIVVVGNVYKSPKQRADHQEGLNRFIKSILILVVSVLVMSLIMFASRMIMRSILGDKGTNQFPIMVTSEKTGKTFCTNITGYYRYKCQSNNLIKRAASAIIYIALSICNLLFGLLMIVRFLVIVGFSIYGIFLSIVYALNNENLRGKVVSFQDWALWYGIVSVFPVIVAILQLIQLEISCTT